MALLSVLGVSKTEKGRYVVEKVSFEQENLERIAIVGETGSGKTSLLKLLGGLAQPDEGAVWFADEKVKGPLDQLIPGHKGIAYLSQHFELRNNYWVHELLSYANELPAAKARQLYQLCRIEHLLERRTDQLSGGERQRVALARLLSNLPRLFLLDEPFSNLDRSHRQIIKEVINDLGAALKITFILVAHDPADILSWADRVLVLQEGRLIQNDTASNVYYKPVNEYCAGLLGDYNLFSLTQERNLLIRPELIDIHPDPDFYERKAMVNRSVFNGNYHSIEVEVQDQKLWVQNVFPFDTGQVVSISLQRAGDWEIK